MTPKRRRRRARSDAEYRCREARASGRRRSGRQSAAREDLVWLRRGAERLYRQRDRRLRLEAEIRVQHDVPIATDAGARDVLDDRRERAHCPVTSRSKERPDRLEEARDRNAVWELARAPSRGRSSTWPH